MKKLVSIISIIALLSPVMAVGAQKKATLINNAGNKKIVAVGSIEAQNLFGKGYRLMKREESLGSAAAGTANIKWVQGSTYTLAGSGSILGATSITLKSFKTIEGVLLTMSNFGTQGYATIEPGTSNEEQITFTGITQNANGTATLTGVKNVLNLYPYTETSGTVKTHSGGTKFVLSNTAGFYNTFVNKENSDTLNGIYTFTNRPLAPITPASSNNQVATIYDIQQATSTGGINANEATKGVGQLSTKAQAALGTRIGSTGARLILPASMATSTPMATTSIPVTGTNGKLSDLFTDFSTNKTWTGTNTFNATTTLTKNYINTYPTASTTIATKGYVDSGSAGFKTGRATYDISTANGNQTIAHGLGYKPRLVVLNATLYVAYNTGGSTSYGTYDGATMTGNAVLNQISTVYYDSATTYILRIIKSQTTGSPTDYTTATITVDATNITLAWTKTGAPTGTAGIQWTVYK